MRIGTGYDVHKFCEDRPLIIGGVTIPYEKGLLGHSDADVLTHAIMDALLGAAALGDIGKLFPDTDPAFKGADSIKLLEEVGGKLVMNFAGGAAEDVEADAEVGKRLLDDAVIAVHHVLHGASLLLRTDGHGYAVLIAATHKEHLTSLQTQVSRINICWHIHACQVPDVDRAVGVRQCCRYGCSFVVLIVHVFF